MSSPGAKFWGNYSYQWLPELPLAAPHIFPPPGLSITHANFLSSTPLTLPHPPTAKTWSGLARPLPVRAVRMTHAVDQLSNSAAAKLIGFRALNQQSVSLSPPDIMSLNHKSLRCGCSDPDSSWLCSMASSGWSESTSLPFDFFQTDVSHETTAAAHFCYSSVLLAAAAEQ